MDDDFYDEDYSEDARFESYYALIKEEHGAELAQEDLNEEVFYYVVSAHEKAWPAVEAEIAKGRARLTEGEREEGAFHLFRALDDYIKTVLSSPVRSVFVDRFNRSLQTTEKTEKDLFKAVYGAGGAMNFAIFGVAVIAPNAEERERLVSAFEAFKAHWGRRNDLFRTVEAATDGDIRTLQEFVNGPFETIAQIAQTVANENQRRRREYQLTPQRVSILESLVAHFDLDSDHFVPEDQIIRNGDVAGHELLSRLGAEGFIEHEGSFLDRAWRLTRDGRRHFREFIVPNRGA